MIDVKYYLVALADRGITRNVEFVNRLVVGLNPTDWFVESGWNAEYVLLNFWEISEGIFGEFPHEDQENAWDEFRQIDPDAY